MLIVVRDNPPDGTFTELYVGDPDAHRFHPTSSEGNEQLSVTVEGLEARKAAIGETAPTLLEKRWVALGKNGETQAETLHTKRSKERKDAEDEGRTAEQAVKLAEYQATEADRRTAEAAANYDAAVAVIGSSDLVAPLDRSRRSPGAHGPHGARLVSRDADEDRPEHASGGSHLPP